MATETLYIDSRTKIRGHHADFSISLPEQMTLRGARLFVDAIRTTDTFPTVSSRNRYVFFLNGSGGLNAYALTLGAYTGTTFAAELAAKSGRSCTLTPAAIASSSDTRRGLASSGRIRSSAASWPAPSHLVPHPTTPKPSMTSLAGMLLSVQMGHVSPSRS